MLLNNVGALLSFLEILFKKTGALLSFLLRKLNKTLVFLSFKSGLVKNFGGAVDDFWRKSDVFTLYQRLFTGKIMNFFITGELGYDRCFV
jgi:hypothetical protein